MKRKLILFITFFILPVIILCGCDEEILPDRTTENAESTTTSSTEASTATTTVQTSVTESVTESTADSHAASVATPDENEEQVWVPASGTKYHKNASCSNMKNPRQISLEDAKASGYTPCKKCYK